MFGYVRKSKVAELVRLYENLLELHPYRNAYPQTYLFIKAQVEDLKDELGLRPSSKE
jgi:hypothetical protein